MSVNCRCFILPIGQRSEDGRRVDAITVPTGSEAGPVEIVNDGGHRVGLIHEFTFGDGWLIGHGRVDEGYIGCSLEPEIHPVTEMKVVSDETVLIRGRLRSSIPVGSHPTFPESRIEREP